MLPVRGVGRSCSVKVQFDPRLSDTWEQLWQSSLPNAFPYLELLKWQGCLWFIAVAYEVITGRRGRGKLGPKVSVWAEWPELKSLWCHVCHLKICVFLTASPFKCRSSMIDIWSAARGSVSATLQSVLLQGSCHDNRSPEHVRGRDWSKQRNDWAEWDDNECGRHGRRGRQDRHRHARGHSVWGPRSTCSASSALWTRSCCGSFWTAGRLD